MATNISLTRDTTLLSDNFPSALDWRSFKKLQIPTKDLQMPYQSIAIVPWINDHMWLAQIETDFSHGMLCQQFTLVYTFGVSQINLQPHIDFLQIPWEEKYSMHVHWCFQFFRKQLFAQSSEQHSLSLLKAVRNFMAPYLEFCATEIPTKVWEVINQDDLFQQVCRWSVKDAENSTSQHRPSLIMEYDYDTGIWEVLAIWYGFTSEVERGYQWKIHSCIAEYVFTQVIWPKVEMTVVCLQFLWAAL